MSITGLGFGFLLSNEAIDIALPSIRRSLSARLADVCRAAMAGLVKNGASKGGGACNNDNFKRRLMAYPQDFEGG